MPSRLEGTLMKLSMVQEAGVQFMLLLRGQTLPRVAAVRPDGYAEVALLPSVAPVGTPTFPETDLPGVLAYIHQHRDGFLAEWLASNPLAQPAERDPVPEPRCRAIQYDPGRGWRLQLEGGSLVMVGAKGDPRFQNATEEQLAAVEPMVGGEVLYFSALGFGVRLPEFLAERLAAPRVPERAAPPSRPLPPNKSLLGLFLYREGYLSQQQLQAIAQRQQQLAREGRQAPFGQIAVQAGFINPEQLQFAVHLQQQLATGGEDVKPLVFDLLESATVKPSVLLTALEEMARSGGTLADVLVRRGDVSPAQMERFLGRQEAQRIVPAAPATPTAAAPTPAEPAKAAPAQMVKSLLGIILEREDYLNQVQVREVIAAQERFKAEGKPNTFGEVAMALNYITSEQLRFAIQLQKKLAYVPGKPKPLGCFLLENGVVKPSQIHLALDEQQKTGRRLGEILVEQGFISEGMLEVFLNMQKAQG